MVCSVFVTIYIIADEDADIYEEGEKGTNP